MRLADGRGQAAATFLWKFGKRRGVSAAFFAETSICGNAPALTTGLCYSPAKPVFGDLTLSLLPHLTQKQPFFDEKQGLLAFQIAISSSDIAISETEFAIWKPDFAMSESDFVISKADFAISEPDIAMSDNDFAISKADFAI